MDSSEKVYGILAYFGLLWIIPVAAGKTAFSKFHGNQGLVLFLIELIGGIVLFVGQLIPFIRIIFLILGGLFEMACFAAAIYGIVIAASGEMKEIPVVGAIKIIK